MRHFTTALAMTAVLSHAGFLFIGCSRPPTESELRTVAECYLRAIYECRQRDQRLPKEQTELLRAMTERDRKHVMSSHYEVKYQLFPENEETSFSLRVGNIIKDGRELHFDSRSETWFFDS